MHVMLFVFSYTNFKLLKILFSIKLINFVSHRNCFYITANNSQFYPLQKLINLLWLIFLISIHVYERGDLLFGKKRRHLDLWLVNCMLSSRQIALTHLPRLPINMTFPSGGKGPGRGREDIERES